MHGVVVQWEDLNKVLNSNFLIVCLEKSTDEDHVMCMMFNSSGVS